MTIFNFINLKVVNFFNDIFGGMSGCPIFKMQYINIVCFAFSANGTSFLIGDSGILCPFFDMLGILISFGTNLDCFLTGAPVFLSAAIILPFTFKILVVVFALDDCDTFIK